MVEEAAPEITPEQDPTEPDVAETAAPEADASDLSPPLEGDPQAQREDPKGVEQITVTARRREELLQETPLSVTAFSEFDLEQRSIESVEDIAALVPNLEFDSTAGNSSSARIHIRGVGQEDQILTADPGVGLYIDGIYLARSTGAIFDVVDLERVEVLRGPQGALYGKSTIGGAINVITRKPDFEFGGRLFGAVGHDERRDVVAQTSIPLIENKLYSNLAFSTRNKDGFSRDRATGEDLQDTQRNSARATLLWMPTESTEVTLRASRTHRREESLAFKLQAVNPDNPFIVTSSLLGVDFGEGLNGGPFSVSLDAPSRNDVDTYDYSMHFDWDLGDGFLGSALTLQTITAWRKVEAKINTDIDGSSDGGVSNLIDDEQRQFSQEVRLSGNAMKGKLDYGVGGLYFRENGRSSIGGSFFDESAAALRQGRSVLSFDPVFDAYRNFLQGAIDAPGTTDPFRQLAMSALNGLNDFEATFVSPFELGRQAFNAPGTPQPIRDGVLELLSVFLRDTTLGLIDAGPVLEGIPIPEVQELVARLRSIDLSGSSDEEIDLAFDALALSLYGPDDNFFSTRNETENINYATYAYASYQLTDAIAVELAGRYNYEIKDLYRTQLLLPSFQTLLPGASEDVTFRDFSPSLTLSWQVNPDFLSYFRVARGFKSGGFNGRATRVALGGVTAEQAGELLEEFDPETLTSFELGFKTTWNDGRLVANTSLFYNLYKDIQQNRIGIDDAGQFNAVIDNAAQATIQGLELEVSYIPSFFDDVTIQGGASLTYGRFTEFPGALANPAFDPQNPDAQPLAIDGEDLHLVNVPLFTGSLVISKGFSTPWGDGIAAVDYTHRTRSFNDIRNSDFTKSPKRGLLGTRVAFFPNTDSEWSIAVVGRNILDREYVANGLDLFDETGFASAQYVPPRSFSFEVSYRF